MMHSKYEKIGRTRKCTGCGLSCPGRHVPALLKSSEMLGGVGGGGGQGGEKHLHNMFTKQCTHFLFFVDCLFAYSFMVPSPHRKQKSRMEEINEIIARSQTRAQAMMASGAYLDGTFKHLNPSRDFNLSAATNASGEVSPDTSLALSDTSFASGGMFNNSFLNLSGAFPPGTPRK